LVAMVVVLCWWRGCCGCLRRHLSCIALTCEEAESGRVCTPSQPQGKCSDSGLKHFVPAPAVRAGVAADGPLTPLRRCDLGYCAGGWRRQTGGSGISTASLEQTRRWRIVLPSSGRRSSANPRFFHLRGQAQSRLAVAQPKAAVSQTARSLGAEPPAEAADRPVFGAERRGNSIPRRLRPSRQDRWRSRSRWTARR